MNGGLLIKEARLRAGLTQAQLAERLGTKQSAVARWESGRRAVVFETVARAVRACGFDLSIMLTPLDDQDVLQALQNMSLTPAQRLDLLLNMFDVEEWARGTRRVG